MTSFTNSIDQIKRTDVRVTHRVSAFDIAAYLVTDFKRDDEKSVAEQYPTQRKVMAAVRRVVLLDGSERPLYRIGDEGMEDAHRVALAHVLRLWKMEGSDK
jgi:hypothetical protein